MKSFKWAFDPTDQKLMVWPVSGPESWAIPQHGDVLSSDEYASFYQGRLVLNDDRSVESFVFYDDRPFKNHNEDDAVKASLAIGDWIVEYHG